jgi:hypothetical protein
MPAWLHAPATARLVFATLLVTLGVTSPAAAVDLSGDYVGFALVPFTVTFVQTGTALQMIGHVGVNSITYPLSAAGTVDPATGAFSVAGEITGACPEFVYSGTGDGEELSGTFTSPTCPSGPVSLTKCGNGVIDPMENCEDGNIGYGLYRAITQDPVTSAIVFNTTLDALKLRPGAIIGGDQIFAIRPDGSGLRQLTDATGVTTNPDGSLSNELPGPYAYSGASSQ